MQPARRVFTVLAVVAALAAGCAHQAAAADDEAAQNNLPPIAQLLLNVKPGKPWKWPKYERGAPYKWVLSPTGRNKGMTFLGTGARLRKAMNKLHQGQNLTIATIGGSITAGQGAVDGHSWVQYLENFMIDQHGGVVSLANGAVPGTLSAYMSVCLNLHIPKHADVVFIEYSLNDPSVSTPPFGSPQRKHFERLLRKLLMLPNRPAVILMHSYSWRMTYHNFYGQFWGGAEREYAEFAHYYDVPMVSVKSCCHQLMAHNVTGFRVDLTRLDGREQLGAKVWGWDGIHPDGLTGNRVMGELAAHALESALKSLDAQLLSEVEEQVALAPLPAPMIPNNYQSLTDLCFIGNHFKSIVAEKAGFEWIDEAKGKVMPKWGMVATEVGSVLRLKVSTMAPSATAVGTPKMIKHRQNKKMKHPKAAKEGGKPPAEHENLILVELAYLKSYEKMGRANVSCVSGCQCATTKLEGYTEHRNSQLHLHNFHVSQSPECIIEIKVRPDSKVKGDHKVKVAGLIVSEEAGEEDGIRNSNAIEYVHDVSLRSKDGMRFELKNHI